MNLLRSESIAQLAIASILNKLAPVSRARVLAHVVTCCREQFEDRAGVLVPRTSEPLGPCLYCPACGAAVFVRGQRDDAEWFEGTTEQCKCGADLCVTVDGGIASADLAETVEVPSTGEGGAEAELVAEGDEAAPADAHPGLDPLRARVLELALRGCAPAAIAADDQVRKSSGYVGVLLGELVDQKRLVRVSRGHYRSGGGVNAPKAKPAAYVPTVTRAAAATTARNVGELCAREMELGERDGEVDEFLGETAVRVLGRERARAVVATIAVAVAQEIAIVVETVGEPGGGKRGRA